MNFLVSDQNKVLYQVIFIFIFLKVTMSLEVLQKPNGLLIHSSESNVKVTYNEEKCTVCKWQNIINNENLSRRSVSLTGIHYIHWTRAVM